MTDSTTGVDNTKLLYTYITFSLHEEHSIRQQFYKKTLCTLLASVAVVYFALRTYRPWSAGLQDETAVSLLALCLFSSACVCVVSAVLLLFKMHYDCAWQPMPKASDIVGEKHSYDAYENAMVAYQKNNPSEEEQASSPDTPGSFGDSLLYALAHCADVARDVNKRRASYFYRALLCLIIAFCAFVICAALRLA